MSTIAAGTTTNTALVSTGDTSGQLVFQTNGTTTAVTIGTNQVVTLAQPLPVASGGTGGTSTTFCNLATNVTGTLPIANGGTGSTSTTYCSLTTNVTGTLPAGNGGTGNTFFSVSGPASSIKTYTFPNENMSVGFRNVPQSGAAKTGSYTLAVDDVGEFIQISTGGSIVIPTSVFSTGDVISLYNNTSGNITITCSAPTAYIAGTNTVVTSITLATRGLATILFYSATACVVSGNVS